MVSGGSRDPPQVPVALIDWRPGILSFHHKGVNMARSITKKKRFEAFKRDGFTCQYCGSTPPKIILELDHITPVCEGGDDDMDNLITACFDCNRGKAGNSLTSIPKTVEQRHQESIAREEQLKAYKKHKKAIKARTTREINSVEGIFRQHFPNQVFTDDFHKSLRFQFLPSLDVETLKENMEMACGRRREDPVGAIKYFCGINWRQIKGDRYG